MLQVLALIVVATIGLAHGGLDWSVAKCCGLRTTARASIYFLMVYGFLVLFSGVVWSAYPRFALGSFLLMSMIHFAHDWRVEMPVMPRYVLGVAIVCLPTLGHYQAVQSIIELLLLGANASDLVACLYCLALISAFLLAVQCVYLTAQAKPLAGMLLLILLLGVLLTPMVYFALYFCAVHAPKHWRRMRAIGVYDRLGEGIIQALWPTVTCVVSGGLIVYYLSRTISFSDALCQTVFIGLAALTVPHWLLIEVYGNYLNFGKKSGVMR